MRMPGGASTNGFYVESILFNTQFISTNYSGQIDKDSIYDAVLLISTISEESVLSVGIFELFITILLIEFPLDRREKQCLVVIPCKRHLITRFLLLVFSKIDLEKKTKIVYVVTGWKASSADIAKLKEVKLK